MVLSSCERSSSSRCPGFAQAAAWKAGDPTPVLTTLVHLQGGKDFAHILNYVMRVIVIKTCLQVARPHTELPENSKSQT